MNASTNNLEHHSTGVPLFDQQNKELLEAVSKLETDVYSGRIDIDHTFRKDVCRLMRSLEKYFDEQERWMRETGFCGCEIQKKSYAYFIQEIERATCELENKYDRACELTAFLKNWLISHIRSIDNSLRFHAQTRGLTDNCHNMFEITPSEFMALAKCK